MTKFEAEIQLKRGNKISHKYYTQGEYLYLRNDMLYTEDDYPQGALNDMFWKSIQKFEDGWSVYDDKNKQ
jgi:hypothetical protein